MAHGPSRARPDLLVTYHAYIYLIPFHEVLYNQLIELEPCSLRQITVPGSPTNLTKQGLLSVRSTKVPREPILVAEKIKAKNFSRALHRMIATMHLYALPSATSNHHARATSVSCLHHCTNSTSGCFSSFCP